SEHAFTVGSINLRQGCPPRGGIRRKSAANPRSDEQKLHTRPQVLGEAATQAEALNCTETLWEMERIYEVKVIGLTWGELTKLGQRYTRMPEEKQLAE